MRSASGPPRSALYVPGHRTDLLERATDRGADALIVDLEDAVPADRKSVAREFVADWLREQEPGRSQLWVRVNPGGLRARDVEAVASAAALDGVCLAKTERPSEVATTVDQLAAAGSDAAVAAVLETAGAVLAAGEIARSPRVRRLQLGEADLVAELGLEPDDRASQLMWLRTMAVLASSAAGIEPPLGPVSTNFRDLDTLRDTSIALRRMGYRGRACIHPAQLAVVHDVFTPTAAEVAAAQELVDRFEQAGGGAVVDVDGAMVDEAVVRRSRRLLAQARSS